MWSLKVDSWTTSPFSAVRCRSRRSNCENTVNDGWIPFSCFNFRVLALLKLAQCHAVMAYWDVWTWMLLLIPAHFPLPRVKCYAMKKALCWTAELDLEYHWLRLGYAVLHKQFNNKGFSKSLSTHMQKNPKKQLRQYDIWSALILKYTFLDSVV